MVVIIGVLLDSHEVWAAVPESTRSRKAIAGVVPKLGPELKKRGQPLGAPVFVRIFRETKELEIWLKQGRAFELFKIYPIYTFSGALGPKLKEGDRQAPEGFYYVPSSRLNPNSRFHLSFNLGYPNRYDRAHGRIGSALMVHGSTVSIGCFAMTDLLIEEIYTIVEAALRNGQKFFRVHIFPFRMTAANMRRYQKSCWIPFWENLKEGFDFFERTKAPPNVTVRNQRYEFSAASD